MYIFSLIYGLKLGVKWKIDYLGEIAKGVLVLEGKVYVSFITMHFTYFFYAFYKLSFPTNYLEVGSWSSVLFFFIVWVFYLFIFN